MQAQGYKQCSTCKQDRPLELFHRDSRYRDGFNGRCKLCKRAAERARGAEQTRTRRAARLAEDERRAADVAAALEPGFGSWLAGFIDGEGCFVIPRQSRRGYTAYVCAFRLSLRDDDRAILQHALDTTGIGRLYATTPRVCRGADNPSCAWSLNSKSDCLTLVRLLERFPLRSKKARDFAIWREAVILWQQMGKRSGLYDGPADWSAMAVLNERLVASHAYAA